MTTKTILHYRIKSGETVSPSFITIDASTWSDKDIKVFCSNKAIDSPYAFKKSVFGSYTYSDPTSIGKWKPGLGPWDEETFEAACDQAGLTLAENLDKCHRAILGWSKTRGSLEDAKIANREWPKLLKLVQAYEQTLLLNGLIKR